MESKLSNARLQAMRWEREKLVAARRAVRSSTRERSSAFGLCERGHEEIVVYMVNILSDRRDRKGM